MMKRILMIFVIASIACACGGAGGSAIAIKTGGKDVSLASKSSGTYKTVKTFTDIDQNITKATAFDIYLANYEMDSTSPMTMRKPLTSADQVRLSMQLIGAEGTDQNSEFKPGVYKADPAGKYMKLDSLGFTTFVDGKEVNTRFETMSSTSKITGQVEVKSVTADAISGTIDVTEGDKTIKGDFTAKIAAKK
jgi:hypothetical protein